MKKYTWKTYNTSNNQVEVQIVGRTFKSAENKLMVVCKKLNLKPIEYLGWEE